MTGTINMAIIYSGKRQLPAVGLLPSGPEPVPAIMVADWPDGQSACQSYAIFDRGQWHIKPIYDSRPKNFCRILV